MDSPGIRHIEGFRQHFGFVLLTNVLGGSVKSL
jgi:hypothetical protein